MLIPCQKHAPLTMRDWIEEGDQFCLLMAFPDRMSVTKAVRFFAYSHPRVTRIPPTCVHASFADVRVHVAWRGAWHAGQLPLRRDGPNAYWPEGFPYVACGRLIRRDQMGAVVASRSSPRFSEGART